mgnify:CR=1 FL=1
MEPDVGRVLECVQTDLITPAIELVQSRLEATAYHPDGTIESNFGTVRVKMLEAGVLVYYTNRGIAAAMVAAFGAAYQITQPKPMKLLIMRKPAG